MNIFSTLWGRNHAGPPLPGFANSNKTLGALEPRAEMSPKKENLAGDVLELTQQDRTGFVDNVDEVHPTLDSRDAEHVTTLKIVRGAIQQLPASVAIHEGLSKSSDRAMGSGGVTDIWRGMLGDDRVAIKAFRINSDNLAKAKEILWVRIPLWTILDHPNILPFRGVDMTLFPLSLVYDLGQTGNVTEYIALNLGVSRQSLLLDAAKGLEYLHSLDIPHGGIKGANVIINHQGRACLTDYGLAPISTDPRFNAASTLGSIHTARWLAPELMNHTPGGNARPMMETKPADVFAFGMFAVEVFTGKVPFEEVERNGAVVLRILQGGRPRKPQNASAVGLTDEMWALIEVCWRQDPTDRPTMQEVVRRLREFAGDDGNLAALPEELRIVTDMGESSSLCLPVAAGAPRPPEAIRSRKPSGVAPPRPQLEDLEQGAHDHDPPPAGTPRNWSCILFYGAVITLIVFFPSASV